MTCQGKYQLLFLSNGKIFYNNLDYFEKSRCNALNVVCKFENSYEKNTKSVQYNVTAEYLCLSKSCFVRLFIIGAGKSSHLFVAHKFQN